MAGNLAGSGVIREIRVQTRVIHVDRQNIVRIFVVLEDRKDVIEEIGDDLSAVCDHLRGAFNDVFGLAPVDHPRFLVANEGMEGDSGCSEHDQVAGVND